MENSKLKLILASSSPRRKELLGHLKIPFVIKTLNVPEESDAKDPRDFCLEIAKCKGDAVLNHDQSDNVLIVSADTIVSLGLKIYGKPSGRDEARVFLQELAGKSHSVFTAVAVKMRQNGKVAGFSFVEESQVTFNPISEYLMETYLDTGDSLDKAGAYGIQGGSLAFISKVDGCYANVVGFPLSRFVVELEKFLLKQFPGETSWSKLFHS